MTGGLESCGCFLYCTASYSENDGIAAQAGGRSIGLIGDVSAMSEATTAPREVVRIAVAERLNSGTADVGRREHPLL